MERKGIDSKKARFSCLVEKSEWKTSFPIHPDDGISIPPKIGWNTHSIPSYFFSYPKYPSSSYSQVPSFDHRSSTTQLTSTLHCQHPTKVHAPLQDPVIVDVDAPPSRTANIGLRFRALPNFSFDFTFFSIAIFFCFSRSKQFNPPGQTLLQRLTWHILSVLIRRQGVFLFAPLLYISGMLLYMGSVSFDVVPVITHRPAPGSVYRSPQLYAKL